MNHRIYCSLILLILNSESVFGQLEEEIIYSIQQIEESEVRLD